MPADTTTEEKETQKAASSHELILEMKGIRKSFPGVDVFTGFDFDLRKGEVHCICGENGAGKSTLIKILSGAYAPDGGEIIIDGKKIDMMTPRSAMKLGIQTIYQEHALYPLLPVFENLFAGNELARGPVISRAAMVARSSEVLKRLDSNISPYEIVGNLGSGEQKTIEIARAFIQESKIMVLDEPTASFSQKETDHLLGLIKVLSKKEGISIIYISHHLDEVFKIADRVTVIRDGQKIRTYETANLTEQQLIRDMVGRDVSAFYKRERTAIGDVVFEARDVAGKGVNHASLMVRSGEVLGIAGMVGSGRTELAELLFGVEHMHAGEIKIRGRNVHIHTPLDAIANRMCFITEDRQSSGLFLIHSIVKNAVIASYAKTRMPFALPAEDVRLAKKYVKAMNVITPSVEQKVVFLSGGNQQKVVLAKWFATAGDIFIFDEPTRGIDVGAKEEIYKIMTGLLKEGKSIILISSDMPELIAMSDRIMVMRNGAMVAEVNRREDICEENILNYSIGGGA
jgi:ribose transport system ATP-binding protein